MTYDCIWSLCHSVAVSWIIEIGDEFEPEFDELHEDVRTELLALTRLHQHFGPQLGRPRVDTLNGSRHANMKELRFSAADGEWRVACAFDATRRRSYSSQGINQASVKSGSTVSRWCYPALPKTTRSRSPHAAGTRWRNMGRLRTRSLPPVPNQAL